MRSIGWLVLYSIIFAVDINRNAKLILLILYIFVLLVTLYKKETLLFYRVAVPQKISGGLVALLCTLSVVGMNSLSTTSGNDKNEWQIYGIMLCMVFMEEFFFRGYLLREICLNFKIKSDMKCIIWSGALFALAHIVNLYTGADAADTALQMLSAFGMAIILGIVTIATNSILPGVLIHYLINISALGIKKMNVWQQGAELLAITIGTAIYLKKYSGGNKT